MADLLTKAIEMGVSPSAAGTRPQHWEEETVATFLPLVGLEIAPFDEEEVDLEEYLRTAQDVVETCEYLLQQPDPENYWVSWST